jgi:hypothetical protein
MPPSRRLHISLAFLLLASLACNLKGNMLWNLAGPQAPADIAATFAAPAADDASVEECLAPREEYAFSYENLEVKVDGPNAICNADFILHNLGQKSFSAIVHIAWDTTVEQSQFWEVKPLVSTGPWIEHVNETHLIQNSYLRVTHLLVVRDAPECWWLASPAQQTLWETIATPIEKLACP